MDMDLSAYDVSLILEAVRAYGCDESLSDEDVDFLDTFAGNLTDCCNGGSNLCLNMG